MMKFISFRILFLGLTLLILPFVISTPTKIFAGTGGCQLNTGNFVINGLITTRDLTKSLNTATGSSCVINTSSAIIRFTDSKTNALSLNSYAGLKTTFYTNSKASSAKVTKKAAITTDSQSQLSLTSGTADYLYNFTSSLTIATPITNTGNTLSAVVFVDGNLSINANITYNLQNKGLVFIVQGDINIDPTVTTINAVLISTGSICTYYGGGACATTLTLVTSPLTINGNLISLTSTSPIKLRRALEPNTTPAEKITFQPKYLVILKDLLYLDLLIFS